MPNCGLFDFGCQAGNTVVDTIMPYILPAIIVLIALFILPRAGKKGWILSLIVLVGLAAWYMVPEVQRVVGF